MSWVVVHGMASLKSGLVREVGLAMPYNHEQVVIFLINTLKGILSNEESTAIYSGKNNER